MTPPSVDVYPVGWLAALQRAHRLATYRNLPDGVDRWAEVARILRIEWRYTRDRAADRNWRAVKNTLNGYLAEPTPFPDGMTRCGTGWTRDRALRSLRRHGYPGAD